MEHAEMNAQKLEETAHALAASRKGMPKVDDNNGPRIARSSTTAKPSVSMRKMALSLSQFLKKQRSSLPFRRQDDGK
jgi:hypothetical protein